MEEITKDMTIGEVVNKHPEAASIMLGYGLHCIGCAVNPFETIENGCLGHGMDRDTINNLISDLNKEVESVLKRRKQNYNKTIILTDRAVDKLNKFMREENNLNSGIRLNVAISDDGTLQCGLEFSRQANKNEETFYEGGIKIFVDKNVVNMIKGTEIEYIENENGSGFKINNPNVQDSASGCGCH